MRPVVLSAAALLFAAGPALAEDDGVRVTVVAILATERNAKIDDKLAEIAAEVRKWDPALTGFRVDRTTSRAVPVGVKETFPLVEDATLALTVRKREDDGRVSLSIKPPLVGEILYSCKCGKFFPVVTRYLTRDKDRLIVAVMVKPCKPAK